MNREYEIVKALIDKGLTISVAESCTCGLFASKIGNVPGASAIFNQGFITYSNESKIKLLKVKRKSIEFSGAVSHDVASSMAYGVQKVSKSDIGVAITGIAGPDGGTEEKPVGLVYVAVAYKKECLSTRNEFKGTRQEIREQACEKAFSIISSALKGDKK